MAFQGVPKWSKGCPRGPKKIPKSAQEEKKGVEGHPKEANKAQNIYTQKNIRIFQIHRLTAAD